jgi:hypothetical protein
MGRWRCASGGQKPLHEAENSQAHVLKRLRSGNAPQSSKKQRELVRSSASLIVAGVLDWAWAMPEATKAGRGSMADRTSG